MSSKHFYLVHANGHFTFRLTAFVLRTYAQAQKYIFVDDKDIKDSVNFLLKLQQSDGCFKKIGMVHHKEMTVSFPDFIPIFV